MTECKKCGNEYSRDYCDFCRRTEKWNPNKYVSKFPPRIREDLKTIDIKVSANELIFVRSGGGLFINGEIGSGKTLYAVNFLLASLRQTFIKQYGPRVHKFITVPDLLEDIRKSFDKETETDPVGFYSNVDLLILDDLGIEKTTDWTLEKLYQIINFRYENLKSTIFTSERPLKELAELFGNRIPSRIQKMSMVKRMKEIDYRLEK